MTPEITITGDKQLDRKLQQLGKRGRTIARQATKQGGTVLAKEIRRRAPVGKTKSLKKSIGAKSGRSKGNGEGVITAKAGVNVGKKKKSRTTKSGRVIKANYAPHGHLATLGTKARRTKSGANRGSVKANDFVMRGQKAGARAAIEKTMKAFRDKLEKEAKR